MCSDSVKKENKTSINRFSATIIARVILSVMILTLFLPMTSADWEWDNCGEYDDETQTMCVYNMFCYGSLLGCATLESPDNVYVMYGEERKVGWFSLENYVELDGEDVWGIVELYEDHNGEWIELERNYQYKKQHWEEEEYDIYERVCTPTGEYIGENNTEIYDCEIMMTGVGTRWIEEWQAFNSQHPVEVGNETIGLFTEVMPEERGEWIPTLYGVQIPQWAAWTPSMGKGLLSYWKLDEGAGTIAFDELGINNGSNAGAVLGAFTILNNSYFFVGDFVSANMTNPAFNIYANFSMSFWFNSNNYAPETYLFDRRDNGVGDNARPFSIMTIGGLFQVATANTFPTETAVQFTTPVASEIYHGVVTRNDSTLTLYINGTRIGNSSVGSGDLIDQAEETFMMGSKTNGANSLNGQLDEIGFWNRTLTASEVNDLYNDHTGLPYLPDVNASINLDSPPSSAQLTDTNVNFTATVTPNVNLNLTNITLYLYNGTGSFHDPITVFITADPEVSNSTNISVFDLNFGNYTWNVLACVNDSNLNGVCNFAPANQTFNITRYLVNNQSFALSTIEGNIETFEIFINVSESVSITSPFFIYNFTNQGIGVQVDQGNSQWKITKTITTSPVSAVIDNQFFWNLHFDDGYSENTTLTNQTVAGFGIDNCTVNRNPLMNFTLLDEEEQTEPPNPDIEIWATVYSLDRSSLISNFSQQTNSSPLTICVNTSLFNDTSYSLDTVVKYTALVHAIEYYNIANFTLTNNTGFLDIKLFDLNSTDSTEFQLTFTGSDYLPVERALVNVDRQYVEEGRFKTVELPMTDTNGQAILHLVRNDIVYNLIIIKNGEVLASFETITAFCEDFAIGDCKITLNAQSVADEIYNYDTDLGIIFSGPSYDNNTGIITFTFTSTDGSTKTVLMQVDRNDILGNRSICNDTITSAGGSLSCSVSNIDESLIRAEVFVDGKQAVISQIRLSSATYGAIGFLIFFIMAISMILMFSGSKSGVLWSIILTLAAGLGLGLITGNLYGVGAAGIWIIVVVIIGIWKLNKEKQQ